ncbi:MAG TPA: hypothetical protein VHO90_09045 [Bacteroidales bacterium]|nr:hypothetical protein [Bacteroidales bacterium]
MKLCFRIFLFFLVLTGLGQGTVEAQSRKAEKAEAKTEKVKEKQKKAYLASQKKDRKRRLDMQTPETKKRMKSTGKSAKRINDQNHEPFLKRLFHKKGR